jgi:hypothetical protein
MEFNMNYALVNTANNIVENVIALEEGAEWSPPSGCTIVLIVGTVSIGDTWDGTQFIRQPPPVGDSISEGVQDVIG